MKVYPANTLSRSPEMWRLWVKGFTLEEIGKALGKPASSIYMAAASCGGIAPRAKRRAAGAVGLAEREEISRGIAAGLSMRDGTQLGALGFDRQPRDWPQWRAPEVSCAGC